MSVHVPLSEEAQMEAKEIMAANKNILKPGSGDPTISNKPLDIILGCYWMTKDVSGEKGENMIFEDPNSAIIAYNFSAVSLRAKIKVLGNDSLKYAQFGGKIFETTIGKILFNFVLPPDYPFVNYEVTKKKLVQLVDDLTKIYGIGSVPAIMDKIKEFGFRYATVSGTTWAMYDINVPEEKHAVIEGALKKVEEVSNQYDQGLVSEEEKKIKNIEIWTAAKDDIEKKVQDSLDKTGSVYDLVNSGARGSFGQLTQMIGMKGLIVNTAGETIDFPITSSYKEGLTPLEYFITTHGARKGMTDTALNTAKAGYLTRRLFDVAQDAIVLEEDCKTKEGIIISRETSAGMEVSLSKLVKGRYLSHDVLDKEGKTLFERNHYLTKEDAKAIEDAGVESVTVRSPLTCKTLSGVCIYCYGSDLGRDEVIDIGEAIGTVAAQAIGEPGTQLTMRTFHAGGTASVGGDITQGLPRVEEIFENRTPKNPALVSHIDGIVSEIKSDGKDRTIILASSGAEKSKAKSNLEYAVNFNRVILVKQGDEIKKGDVMTDGSIDLDELFKYAGKEATQNYIIDEITKIYELQGEPVSRKHIEVIIRQMFSRRKIKSPGDTTFSSSDVIPLSEVEKVNNVMKEQNKEEAKTEAVLLGISEVSLTRTSFLSSASFERTTRSLITNSLRGAVDNLTGLKENVIIGRVIPAGTGFPGSRKFKMIQELQEKLDRR